MAKLLLFLALCLPTLCADASLTSTKTAEQYRWGECCDGWHLVKSPSLSIIEERMPPGTSEVRHLHRKAQQFFYVLKGEATLEVGGTELRLKPREGARVPSGTAHQMQNKSTEVLEFMVVSEPPSHGDREPAPKN